MDNENKTNIVVLRLGHRPFRDKRITTHVCLIARAMGANGLLLNSNDPYLESNINSIVKRFGGSFFIKNNINSIEEINNWKESGGKICHLSMYGINLPSIIDKIKNEKKIMIIVGSEKVPIEYYHLSDWNIAIGNQPHSEVAAVAIFLDRYFKDKKDPLLKTFDNANMKVIPTKEGKKVFKID